MRHISIKVRMTIWFTVVMVVISSLMLVFVMLMNRNQVTKPPAAQVVSVVTRNADRLERSFETERQFTSDASHELRTPVAVILAECDSLDHGQPTEEDYRQSVDVIRRQGQQMSRLIGQLLHITRLEQGTQKLQLETADLSQLVEVLCEEQAHLAPEGITLAVHTQPDLLVNGDVTRLSRLLTNLISNAYRYGKPNGHVWAGRANGPCCPSGTTAAASPRRTGSASSSAFTRWTPPGARTAAAWACSWCSRRPGSTAAPSPWTAG